MSCIDVHIQGESQSCLSASVTRIGEGINADATNANAPFLATITAIGEGIVAEVHSAVKGFTASISDAVKHLEVRCSIVCTLEEVINFLNVTPAEIQWITDDMGVYFDVESNTDWIITVGDEAEEIQLIANDIFIGNETYITNGEPIAPNVIELLENSTLIHNETMIQR